MNKEIWTKWEKATNEELLAELGRLDALYESMSAEERKKNTKPMVSECAVSELWVMRQYSALKKDWDDPCATDLKNDKGQTIEVKFRSGGKGRNLFLEQYTDWEMQKKSSTWTKVPDRYVTVFGDGSMWVTNYKKLRELHDSGDLPGYHYCTKHDTWGFLWAVEKLQERGLLRCTLLYTK